ncbi:hypothetical protein [Coralloluteibacterium thermophilus]|uniref:Uncharacterized protein n=1 Tax=Coralloluteibacterium thermophilum TaxID=2707049 RepID=A0ABV9NJ11_9GAMM
MRKKLDEAQAELAKRDAAPAAGIPEGWAEAYRAFVGAFDTPTARMQDDSEYANDARDRLRALNDRFIAAAPTEADR